MSVTIRSKKSRRGATVLYLDIYHEGRRRKMTLATTDMREAKRVKAQVEQQLATEGWGNGVGESMKLKVMIHEYLDYWYATKAPKTAQMDRDALMAFMKIVGDLELGDITAAHFEEFRMARLKEISPTSVNIALRHLKAAFNWAVGRELLKQSPSAKVKLNRVPKNLHPRFLSADEIQRLRAEIEDDAELLRFINFALWTGMRRNEIVNLEWSDVDLDRKTLTIQNKIGFRTKSRKSRLIPINPQLHDMLVSLKALRKPTGRVFTFNYWTVGTRFLRATRAAKLEGKVTLHTLRHTFASHLVMQGVDLASIQEILGHFDVTVTMIYTHLAPGHLAKTVEKLPY